MDYTTYLALFIGLPTAAILYIRHWLKYWHRKGMPGPVWFEYKDFIEPLHTYSQDLHNKFGRVYGYNTFKGHSLAVNDPELLREIMVKQFDHFPNRNHMHHGTTGLGQSLFFVHGDQTWRRHRSILSPAFSSGKLRAMMAHIGDISTHFADKLAVYTDNGKVIDMRKYLGAFTMDVIGTCAYGVNPESIDNPDHPIVTNAKRVLGVDGGLSILLCVLAPKWANVLGLEPWDYNAVQYFNDLTKQILIDRQKRNKYTASHDKSKRRTDFIQLMLDSDKSDTDLGYDSPGDVGEGNSHKPVGTLSHDEMVAQGLLFFIAGYDTTAATLTHALYYLSKHPDCQHRLYEELQTCEEFTYEKLVHLKYLNGVINETLRLAPPLLRIIRTCLKDCQLSNGVTVQKGTEIILHPYALHRDPEYWPNPDEFCPDRWFESAHHPYAYMPFGTGPRVCIGQRFAINEIQMCLAKIISRYEFSLAPGFKLQYFSGNILLTPKELLCNITARP